MAPKPSPPSFGGSFPPGDCRVAASRARVEIRRQRLRAVSPPAAQPSRRQPGRRRPVAASGCSCSCRANCVHGLRTCFAASGHALSYRIRKSSACRRQWNGGIACRPLFPHACFDSSMALDNSFWNSTSASWSRCLRLWLSSLRISLASPTSRTCSPCRMRLASFSSLPCATSW